MVGEQSCYPGSGGKNGCDQCYQCVAHNVATMAQIEINSQPAARSNCGCRMNNRAGWTERDGPRQHPFVVEDYRGQKVRHSRQWCIPGADSQHESEGKTIGWIPHAESAPGLQNDVGTRK